MQDNTTDTNPQQNPNDFVEPIVSADPVIVFVSVVVLVLLIFILKKYLL